MRWLATLAIVLSSTANAVAAPKIVNVFASTGTLSIDPGDLPKALPERKHAREAHKALLIVDARARRFVGHRPQTVAAFTALAREFGHIHDRYERVVRTWRDPEATVCALVGMARVGLAIDAMARAMPLPPDVLRLGKDAAAEYRRQLDEKFEPISARAREYAALADAEARRLVVTNTCARDAARMIARAPATH